jgi:hypothetical protein
MQDASIFKRRETTFNGGESTTGTFIPKQTVTIGRCVDENEDIWTVTDVNGKTHRVDGCELHPHPEAALTNIEFMNLVMTWCKTPLMHAFIFQALDQYAKAVVKADVATLETPFIAGAAWQETAREYMGFAVAREYVEKERHKELTPAD